MSKTTLKIYENVNIKRGKETVVRIALYDRTIGSSLELFLKDGLIQYWYLADAPDSIRTHIRVCQPDTVTKLED